MKCPNCGGELRVTHVFQAGPHWIARDHKCQECGRRTSSVTFLVTGERIGVRALARKIKEQKLMYDEAD